MDVAHFRKLALKRQSEHRKFLAALKKKPPRNLDYLTQEIHEEVFEEIDCLKCANCCKTTGPLFTDADIERIAKFLRIRPGEFISRYLRTDEDGDRVLQQVPCTFLLPDNACSIYAVRPKACREYPHTDRKKIYQINHLTLQNTLICPAAYLAVEKLQRHLEQKK
ncbi:YkgJ family cysteine cluster protein [Planobacterium oryzisoli]|uniref:YkgJ family cysteine cluster protein n=1 Tax=Planobacterium oryzisoli TaxID=2771435 RepID=A0A930YVA0_9FLAO|nr:YkgJ family cysteine cluster protein [Planobacterium oryzisoli]MBF5026926.1 YkgJ family cysteine cluster protein [Planobacterium oryzisoli]